MKRSEIFNLRRFDTDMTRQPVQARQSKNAQAWTVPLKETIKALLQSLPRMSSTFPRLPS